MLEEQSSPKRIGRVPTKLTDEVRLEVVRLYAEWATVKQILKHLKDTYDITFSQGGVNTVVGAKKMAAPLRRFREEYLKRVTDVPISNKRIRINDLENARTKLLEQINSNPCETKQNRQEFMQLVKCLNEVLGSAREETDKNGLSGFVIGDFGDQTDNDLRTRKDELIRQAEIALTGRPSGIDYDPEGAQEPDQIKPA